MMMFMICEFIWSNDLIVLDICFILFSFIIVIISSVGYLMTHQSHILIFFFYFFSHRFQFAYVWITLNKWLGILWVFHKKRRILNGIEDRFDTFKENNILWQNVSLGPKIFVSLMNVIFEWLLRIKLQKPASYCAVEKQISVKMDNRCN